MTRQYAETLRASIERLYFKNKESRDNLLNFESQIRLIIDYVSNNEPPNLVGIYESALQLHESAVGLKTASIKDIPSEFAGCKRDFISVLDDYIKRADEYNLWQ
jgi:hypothetical protein